MQRDLFIVCGEHDADAIRFDRAPGLIAGITGRECEADYYQSDAKRIKASSDEAKGVYGRTDQGHTIPAKDDRDSDPKERGGGRESTSLHFG